VYIAKQKHLEIWKKTKAKYIIISLFNDMGYEKSFIIGTGSNLIKSSKIKIG